MRRGMVASVGELVSSGGRSLFPTRRCVVVGMESDRSFGGGRFADEEAGKKTGRWNRGLSSHGLRETSCCSRSCLVEEGGRTRPELHCSVESVQSDKWARGKLKWDCRFGHCDGM